MNKFVIVIGIILFTVTKIANGNRQCNCITKTPVISSIGGYVSKGSICAGCSYRYQYPPGYDYIDISAKYGQTFEQTFIQNGRIIGQCTRGKECNKRIYVNSLYPLETSISRSTATNSYYTHGYHTINLGRRNYRSQNSKRAINQCNNPPELNVDKDYQDGIINSGCIYKYIYNTGSNALLNIEVSDYITITIYDGNYSVDIDKIFTTPSGVRNISYIYQTNDYNVFTEIKSKYGYITMFLSSSSNKNVNISMLQIKPLNYDSNDEYNDSNNDDDDNTASSDSSTGNELSNTNNDSKIAFILAIISISLSLTAVILCIIIYILIIRKLEKNKVYMQFNSI